MSCALVRRHRLDLATYSGTVHQLRIETVLAGAGLFVLVIDGFRAAIDHHFPHLPVGLTVDLELDLQLAIAGRQGELAGGTTSGTRPGLDDFGARQRPEEDCKEQAGDRCDLHGWGLSRSCAAAVFGSDGRVG